MSLMAIFLGRATVAIGNQAGDWYLTSTAPSAVLFNNTTSLQTQTQKDSESTRAATTGRTKTVWHYRAALAVIALDHANYEDDENSFIVASKEERYNATTQYMRTSTSLSTC